MSRKSQITLFVIIGLVIVISTGAFLFFVNENRAKESFGDEVQLSSLSSTMEVIEYAIDECVKTLYYEGMERYGFGHEADVVQHIEDGLDGCMQWDILRTAYPDIENLRDQLSLTLVEEENSCLLDMIYPIRMSVGNEKAEIREFSYSFPKQTSAFIELAEGRTTRDITIRSGENQLELFIPEGTLITDQDNNPLEEVDILISSMENNEEASGIAGEFIFVIEPEGIIFSPAVELRMRISDNIDPKRYLDLNSAYLTENGAWASVPSYVDPYIGLVVGYATHFSTRAYSVKTNNPYSYGLGWVFHEATNSKRGCDALSKEDAFVTYKDFVWDVCEEMDPLYIFIDEENSFEYVGERECEEAEDLEYNQFITCLQGFTKEEELEDFLTDVPFISEEFRETCGTQLDTPSEDTRDGYDSKEAVGGVGEFTITIMGADSESGKRPSFDPSEMVEISLLSDGTPSLAGYDVAEAGRVNEVAFEYSLEGRQGERMIVPDASYPYILTTEYKENDLKEELMDRGIEGTGCTKTTGEFIVKGRYLACSIRNRYNYLGGAPDEQGGELDALNALILYFRKEIEKEDLFFEDVEDPFRYFNLPLDMIDEYQGLPREIAEAFSMYDDSTVRLLECCGDDQYFDSAIQECVKNELPSCEESEEIPCNCGGFVIQDEDFSCLNSLPGGNLCDTTCEVSEEDFLNGNFDSCPAPNNIPCICADSNMIIIDQSHVCVRIPGDLI